MLCRPMPDPEITDDLAIRFEPSQDLETWARSTFIQEDGPLANPDHGHLNEAVIGFLWTNVANARAARAIIGQAELGDPVGAMGKWARARAKLQVEAWFGLIPDFIITVDANYAKECGDPEFCALIEHELYHCAQEHDIYGAPKFRRDGRPVFAIKGHDVEEFVGVVRRYGASATGVGAMVEAANAGPQIASASIAGACGTCLTRAA